MELLRSDQIDPEPGERVFRHGTIGTIVMLAVFTAPIVFLAVVRKPLLENLALVPWYLWLALGPVALLVGLIYAVVLYSLGQVVRRSFLPTNWMMRVSPAGLVLNLRSYQNTHLAEDGPTVARIPWSEVAGARRVRDVTPRRHDDEPHFQTRWLQIELARVDTGPLDARVRAERSCEAPKKKRLGVTSSGRFGHVPVFVAAPGIVRTDWLGRGMLRALEKYTNVGEELKLGAQPSPDVEARMLELVRRGDSLAAVDLARRKLGLSLREARDRVKELEQLAA